jgi:hypothetical protein
MLWRTENTEYFLALNRALHKCKEASDILSRIKRRKANWVGHILPRNWLLKHVIEQKREGRANTTGRGGRRRKRLLDDLKPTRGYWKLKEEALDRTRWRTRSERGYKPVARQNTDWLKIKSKLLGQQRDCQFVKKISRFHVSMYRRAKLIKTFLLYWPRKTVKAHLASPCVYLHLCLSPFN